MMKMEWVKVGWFGARWELRRPTNDDWGYQVMGVVYLNALGTWSTVVRTGPLFMAHLGTQPDAESARRVIDTKLGR